MAPIVNRKILDHALWQEKPFDRKSAWIDLILIANFKDNKRMIGAEEYSLKKGEVVASSRYLARRWGWGLGKVQRFVSFLEKSKMCTQRTEHQTRILNLCNYDRYQFNVSPSGTVNGTEAERRRNGSGTKHSSYSSESKESSNTLSKQKHFDLKAPIEYLNQKTNHNYKSETYADMVRARYNEGRTLEDFKLIVDKKCDDWFTDEKMVKYLRPETLFTKKHFDSYLNEPACKPKTELDQWRARGDQR